MEKPLRAVASRPTISTRRGDYTGHSRGSAPVLSGADRGPVPGFHVSRRKHVAERDGNIPIGPDCDLVDSGERRLQSK